MFKLDKWRLATDMLTLSSLSSVLFYLTTWSEFFKKVSIKQPGPSQKKINCTVLLQGCHGQLLGFIKQPGLDIWKNNQYYLFFKFLKPRITRSYRELRVWDGLFWSNLSSKNWIKCIFVNFFSVIYCSTWTWSHDQIFILKP